MLIIIKKDKYSTRLFYLVKDKVRNKFIRKAIIELENDEIIITLNKYL